MNIQTANRLVALRKERGFSQEELAAKIGVSRQAVSKWERAEASPDTDNLILLARLYQVSLDELLAISDIPASSPPPPEALAEDEADAASEPPEPRPFEAPAPPAETKRGWGRRVPASAELFEADPLPLSCAGRSDLSDPGVFLSLVASRLVDFFHHSLLLLVCRRCGPQPPGVTAQKRRRPASLS